MPPLLNICSHNMRVTWTAKVCCTWSELSEWWLGDTRYNRWKGFYDQLEMEGYAIIGNDPHVLYWEEKDMGEPDMMNCWKEILFAITTGQKNTNNSSLSGKILNQLCVRHNRCMLSNDEIPASERNMVKSYWKGDLWAKNLSSSLSMSKKVIDTRRAGFIGSMWLNTCKNRDYELNYCG